MDFQERRGGRKEGRRARSTEERTESYKPIDCETQQSALLNISRKGEREARFPKLFCGIIPPKEIFRVDVRAELMNTIGR